MTRAGLGLLLHRRVTQVSVCGARQLKQSRDLIGSLMSGRMADLFQGPDRPEYWAFIFQMIRHTEMAAEDYGLGRDALARFVEKPTERPLEYIRALHRFESAVGSAWELVDLVRGKERVYEPGDGSELERLHRIYNRAKHGHVEDDHLVWITNEGLETPEHALRFDELAETIESSHELCFKVMPSELKSAGMV